MNDHRCIGIKFSLATVHSKWATVHGIHYLSYEPRAASIPKQVRHKDLYGTRCGTTRGNDHILKGEAAKDSVSHAKSVQPALENHMGGLCWHQS